MNRRPGWLPDLVKQATYGDWSHYEAAIYGFFCADFVRSFTAFRGRPVKLKRYPVVNGKEATYWHCISTGKNEADRLLDIRRCERIRWPRPCIEHESQLKVWTEKRKGEYRIHIWLESEGYIVVLASRPNYVILWTTFFVEHEHERKKFTRRYEIAKKAEAAQQRTAS